MTTITPQVGKFYRDSKGSIYYIYEKCMGVCISSPHASTSVGDITRFHLNGNYVYSDNMRQALVSEWNPADVARWIPEPGDAYYYADTTNSYLSTWVDSEVDRVRLDTYNVFKDGEEAELHADCLAASSRLRGIENLLNPRDHDYEPMEGFGIDRGGNSSIGDFATPQLRDRAEELLGEPSIEILLDIGGRKSCE